MRFSIPVVGPRRNEEGPWARRWNRVMLRLTDGLRIGDAGLEWTILNILLIIAPVYSSRKPLAVLRPSPVVLVPSEISPIRQLVLVWFELVGYMVWHNWHSRRHAIRAVRAIGLRTGERRTLKSQYGQIGD